MTAIHSELLPGLFAPLTLSSSVLVDGLLCSCFAPPEELHVSHGLCHAAMAPLRLWHACRRLLEDTSQRQGVPLTLDVCCLWPLQPPFERPFERPLGALRCLEVLASLCPDLVAGPSLAPRVGPRALEDRTC